MSYSAAEVERYAYCPLSWSLSKHGHEGMGDDTLRGERAHDAIGKRIRTWRGLVDDHSAALRIALYLALTAASAATLALEIVFLDGRGIFQWILLLMSLTWLLVSAGFLLRAIRKEDAAKRIVAQSGLVDGDLAYSDMDRPAETLRALRYELTGKPDYIVRRADGYIPVEVKTGRTPQRPHDSHLMQLGVYCILVEEKYGKRPPHGVLQYPERSFEVAFTDDFRDQVLETTLKMRLADMTGNVHRVHNSPGKCRGCSRRDACSERLA